MSRNSAIDQLIAAAESYSRWGGKAATKTLVERLKSKAPQNISPLNEYAPDNKTHNLTNNTIPLTFNDIASEASLKAIKKAGDTKPELSGHESFLYDARLEHITDPATKAAFMIDAYVRQIFKWKSGSRVTLGHFYNEKLWNTENTGSISRTTTTGADDEILDAEVTPLIQQIYTEEAKTKLKEVVYTETYRLAIINAMLESCAPIASGLATKKEKRLADGREQLKKLIDYLLLIFTPQELANVLTNSVFGGVVHLLELENFHTSPENSQISYNQILAYLNDRLEPDHVQNRQASSELDPLAGTDAFSHTALRPVSATRVPAMQTPLPSQPYGGSSTFQAAPPLQDGSKLTGDAVIELAKIMRKNKIDKLIVIPHTERVLEGGGQRMMSRDETTLYCFDPDKNQCIASFNLTAQSGFKDFTDVTPPVTPENNADIVRYFKRNHLCRVFETNAEFTDEVTHGLDFKY